MSPKLLVVDDDEEILHLLQVVLRSHGFHVICARSGREGLRQLYSEQPDVVLLDVMMPNMDGWEALRRIREVSALPVIMLTALQETSYVVRGLQTGADDYVSKPFEVPELVARIEAVLRRAGSAHQPASSVMTFDNGNLVIDPACRQVTVRGKDVHLTPTEYRFLLYLCQNAGRVLTFDSILSNVWDIAYEGGDKNVKVYATYLRRKIEADPQNPIYICSERGVGYYMPKL